MKRLLICAFAALTFTACGGGGGGGATSSAGGSILPGIQQAAATASPMTNPAGTPTAVPNMTASGTIKAISGSVFLLYTGTSHGNIDVTTSSSTIISGGGLYVGETVNVTGTGSWSTSIVAETVANAQGGAPIPVPTGVVSTTGTVAAVVSGGAKILLNQGPPHGNIYVTFTGATAQFGSASAGEYAQITGTGALGTAITATVATYYSAAPTSVTVNGEAIATAPYGFTLRTSTGAQVPIVITPASVIAGATLAVGTTVSVVGVGAATSSVTATQVVVAAPTPPPGPQAQETATPAPIAQTHVLTADYLAGMYGTTSVPYATAAKYLTWAQTTASYSTAIRATGIKTMLYTDPNRVQTNDPMYTSNASTFATDCSGNRITVPYGSITQYVMNVYAPTALGPLFQQTIQSESAGTTFDAIFEDNVGPLGLAGVTDMPCNYTDATWDAGEETLATYSPYPVIFNGLSLFSNQQPSPTVSMVNQPNTLGGILEGCYSDTAQPEYSGWGWTAVENTELEVAADNAMFVCLSRDTNDASQNAASRIYTLASFLLTYNPATSVLWQEYSTPSGLHVYPEDQLVAMNPTTAAPSTVSGLQTTSGVYGRQFADCYIAGNFVGACAVAVNPGGSSETFPYPQFQHTLMLSGEGVADGGTVSTQGPPPATTLAPESAEIVFP